MNRGRSIRLSQFKSNRRERPVFVSNAEPSFAGILASCLRRGFICLSGEGHESLPVLQPHVLQPVGKINKSMAAARVALTYDEVVSDNSSF